MPIKIKHAPSAAAIGGTAYTIGRGQRRERDIRFAAEVGLKQRTLDIQGMSVALQAKARAAALEQREEESERLHGLREEELGFRKQQWEDEPARQLQQGLEQQKILQRKVSWQYDEGQKREMAKVTTGIAWLRNQVSAGKWTAEQAEQAEQQLWRKYHSIIPLPVYDDKATPQEIYNSNVVTDSITGAQYRMNERGGFEPVGIDFKAYANLRADVAKAFTSTDAMGNLQIDWEATDKFVDDTMVRFTKIQGFATRAEEEQKSRAQEQEQNAAEQEQVNKQAAVEALPAMFDAIVKGQPKIGRKKKGKPSLFADDVYGEEAYNKVLTEAIGRGEQEGIPPEVIKAELDKWWDEQHDKERGQKFQKFGDRMQFESAAAPTATPASATQKAEPTKRQKAIDYVMSVLQQGQYALLDEKARLDAGVKMLAEAGFEVTADELKTKPAEFDNTAEPQSQEEFIRTIQSMDDKAKAKAYYDKWVGKWR